MLLAAGTATAIWEYPALVAGVIVALAVIGKAVHWVYRWAERIDSSLGYIESEMRFNGGSTMRDAVKRIESRIDHLETTVKEGQA